MTKFCVFWKRQPRRLVFVFSLIGVERSRNIQRELVLNAIIKQNTSGKLRDSQVKCKFIFHQTLSLALLSVLSAESVCSRLQKHQL